MVYGRNIMKKIMAITIALMMVFTLAPSAFAADDGLKTKISGVKKVQKKSYKKKIADVITVSPAYGRTVTLSVYNPYQKKWYVKKKYKLENKKTAKVKITYSSAWKARERGKWAITAPEASVKVDGKKTKLKKATVYTETVNKVVQAKAAVVFDAKTGMCVYAKNATTKRKIASMTKMMTMILLAEHKGLNDRVTINNEAIQARKMSGGMGLKKGDVVTVKDLMYCAMLPSANDAAAASAVAVSGSQDKFKGLMKKKARSIGAVDSTYKYAFGDWYGNAKSTAFDQALIGREFMTNNKTGFLRKVAKTKTYRFKTKKKGITYKVSYSYAGNLILGQLGSVGIKTGYNPPAGRCFTNAWYHKGKLYISVVMGEPSGDQMWTDVKKLTRMTNYLVDKNTETVLVKTVKR